MPRCDICNHEMTCPRCTGSQGGKATVAKGCSYPHVQAAAQLGRRRAKEAYSKRTVRRIIKAAAEQGVVS